MLHAPAGKRLLRTGVATSQHLVWYSRAPLRARSAGRTPVPEGVEAPEGRYRALVRERRAERYHHHLQRGNHAPGVHAEGYRVTLDALCDVPGTIAGLWLLELPHMRLRPLPTTLVECFGRAG